MSSDARSAIRSALCALLPGRGRLFRAALGLLLFSGACVAAAKNAAPGKYRRWLDEEVVYLASDAERKAFLRLESDASREQFIREFWDARNPARGGERNPAREEHYRRLQYANEHFGRESNTPGWKTDMGRTYITLGPPISRASFPSRGQTYPMELWFYRNTTGNPSLPPFFYVLFYMPEDAGDFRYYRPFLDGPLKLVRGTQFQTNRDVYEFLKPLGGDLARCTLSLAPSEPVDTQDFRPSIGSDLLVAKLQNYANDPWEVERVRRARELQASVASWFLVADERPLTLTAVALAGADGEYWLDFATLIDDAAMGRPDGRGNLAVSSGYRLLNEKGALAFEDRQEKSYAAYVDGAFRPFLLTWRIPVAPGRYRLHVEVVNREAGRSWQSERVVAAGGAMLSEPLVAAAAGAAPPSADAAPFHYSGARFVPAAGGAFEPSGTLYALFQLLVGAGGERRWEIEYVLAHTQDRTQRRTVLEEVDASEFRQGRLLKAKSLPLGGLPPGGYRLVINLREPGSPRVAASANAAFRIAETREERAVFVPGDPRSAAPEAARYLRALAAAVQ